ncbi:MAG: hypothetical protein IKN59_03850, partial [Paludibacteraceae bacterium]|nr:hypothetical protein [Paludibacteraceae bacterium]
MKPQMWQLILQLQPQMWQLQRQMWQLIPIERGAVYTADKAYIDFAQMWKMQLAGAFFVMRPKDNMRYEVIREQRDDAFKSDVRADFIIRLIGVKSRKLYPDELRLVKVL